MILKDPAVDSLSSFIGIDGTNITLNSGRIQINLKPLEERTTSPPATSFAACSRSSRKSNGITLFMQPVQDLTVEDRVSRTAISVQPGRCRSQGTRLLGAASCRQTEELAASCATSPATSRTHGLLADLDHRSRHRVAPRHSARRRSTTRSTTPSASGRSPRCSRSSTSTTWCSKSIRNFSKIPTQLKDIYVKSSTGTQVPLSAFTHFEPAAAPLAINHQGQFPVVTLSFNLAPGASLGDAVDAINQGEDGHRHARQASRPAFRARPRRSRRRSRTNRS